MSCRNLGASLLAAAIALALPVDDLAMAASTNAAVATDFSAQRRQAGAQRRPAANRPRPPAANRPRPPAANRPRPPAANRPSHRPRPPAVHRPPRARAWARPRRYTWRPGGAIAAGAAIGFIAAASAAAWAGPPPAPGLCWYYTDWTRRQGFWDWCP
jgi:hypothetical protein